MLVGIRTQFREILCAVTRYLVFQNILIILNARGQGKRPLPHSVVGEHLACLLKKNFEHFRMPQ